MATNYRHVIIDWDEGERWVEARVAKAIELGFEGQLLLAEQALRGHSVLVAVSDSIRTEVAWIKFYLTPDTTAIDLHYPHSDAIGECRSIAQKLADTLGYFLESM